MIGCPVIDSSCIVTFHFPATLAGAAETAAADRLSARIPSVLIYPFYSAAGCWRPVPDLLSPSPQPIRTEQSASPGTPSPDGDSRARTRAKSAGRVALGPEEY